MSEYYEEEYESEFLSEEDIFLIQETYRRQRLKETLIGPTVSTIFHILLIVILAIMITDKYQPELAEIEIKMQEVEEAQIEESPPVEEPVEEVIEESDTVNPILTTVAIETVETNDTALEDVSDDAPSTEDDSAIDAVSDVVVSPSAFASPSFFGGRSAAGRASAVSKFGGTVAGQQNLLKALYWLKKVQNPDGSWGDKNLPAFTGLAMLTFLAYGETPTSKEFGLTVRKAMEWLSIDTTSSNAGRSYSHAIKSYAISEAYAMTGISILEEAMNRNMRIIINGIGRGGSYDYSYRTGRDRDDISLAGWNYQAMKAAYGAGCEEKGLTEAIIKAVGWLKKYADSDNNGDGFPYNSFANGGAGDWKGHFTMRAVGVLCMQLYGEGNYPGVQDEIQKISTFDYSHLSWDAPKKDNLYAWYYATQAMFQKGGTMWKKWNRKFQKVVGDAQHSEGYWEYPGNYHGKGISGLEDKVYATTLCALMLTVYYRYLPSTKGAVGNKGAKKQTIVMEEEGLNLID
ncbi:MAG: hypothetical protein MK132_22045 [Lentisphaerales bacterium]|nr:hypothetical protein [Lentisphaerales bacterium]